jgi:hypothetical protein
MNKRAKQILKDLFPPGSDWRIVDRKLVWAQLARLTMDDFAELCRVYRCSAERLTDRVYMAKGTVLDGSIGTHGMGTDDPSDHRRCS